MELKLRALKSEAAASEYLPFYQLMTNTPLELDAKERLGRKKITMTTADQLAYADESGMAGALAGYLREASGDS